MVDVRAPFLWGHFKDGVLKAYDDVCWNKMGRRSKGDCCLWNGEVKEAISGKKDPLKVMCWISTEVN